MTDPDPRILLILDLDETLIHASEESLDREPDFCVGHYRIYRRPGLETFLRTCQQQFQLAIWSASGGGYLSAVVLQILPVDVSLTFAWSRDRCVHRYDPEWLEPYFVKDLKKVKRQGFRLERTLIVEDTPRQVERNFGNSIYVTPYLGSAEDTELGELSQYLNGFSTVADVRKIEKRGWRNVPDFRRACPGRDHN